MNKKVQKNYEELARSTGLSMDPESGAMYGRRSEFDVVVYAANENYPYMLTAAVSARRPGGQLTKEEGKRFSKENKPVQSLTQTGNVITMSVKNTGNQKKLKENLEESLNALLSFLRLNGFQNCCQICGNPGEADPVMAGLSYMHLCPDCFEKFQHAKAVDNNQKQAKAENVVGGIIGAFLGSLLGVLCIVVLGQLGYVAALSGVVMAVCTMKGYEMLGGKLSTRGIVVSIVLMIVMTYVGNRLDWAILVMREVGLDIITSYQSVGYLVSEGMLGAAYWGNLVMVYLFALLGAVPTVRTSMKNQKGIDRFYRLGPGHME